MRQTDNPRPLAYRAGPYMRARLVERGALDAKIAEADTVELDRAGALTLLVGLGGMAQQISAVELIAGGIVTRALIDMISRYESNAQRAERLLVETIRVNPAGLPLIALLDPEQLVAPETAATLSSGERLTEAGIATTKGGYSLAEFLQLPGRRAPGSLIAQVHWIIARWGELIPGVITAAATAGVNQLNEGSATIGRGTRRAEEKGGEMSDRGNLPHRTAGILNEEEAAPPEAVRAIAALLGRAAAPQPIEKASREAKREKRARAPRVAEPVPSAEAESSAHEAVAPLALATMEGDREIPIDGLDSRVHERAAAEIRRSEKRLQRAQRAVHEALERLSAMPADELGG